MNKQEIQNKGIKLTKHKLAILELFDIYKHLDANKIYNLLQDKNTHISLATIYRVLTTFEANDILVKHKFNEEISTYELFRPDEHHDHLICMKCHKVIEFCDDTIENIQKQIAQTNKFIITHHSLNIYGICENCK